MLQSISHIRSVKCWKTSSRDLYVKYPLFPGAHYTGRSTKACIIIHKHESRSHCVSPKRCTYLWIITFHYVSEPVIIHFAWRRVWSRLNVCTYQTSDTSSRILYDIFLIKSTNKYPLCVYLMKVSLQGELASYLILIERQFISVKHNVRLSALTEILF